MTNCKTYDLPQDKFNKIKTNLVFNASFSMSVSNSGYVSPYTNYTYKTFTYTFNHNGSNLVYVLVCDVIISDMPNASPNYIYTLHVITHHLTINTHYI